MKWIQEGKHYIESGKYTICKYYIRDKKGYQLFYQDTILGTNQDCNVLKKLAENHTQETTP